jgi:hypothetical protein
LIVISGALAVVAFVLLIAGLVSDGLGLVYASIAVSLVSAIFLGVGAFQRRGEDVAPRAAEPAPTSGFAAEPVRVGAFADDEPAEESTVRIAAANGAASSGTVYVVPGRPRYHVEDCRYLTGKDGEPRSLAEARNEGYTACGICRPDENVGAAVPELAFVGGGSDDDDLDDVTDDFADAKPAAPRRTAKRAGTGRTTAAKKTTAKKAAAKKTTAKKTTARKTAAKKTATKKTTARRTPAKKTAAKKAASRTPAKKTTARTAATRSAAKKSTAKKSTAKKTTAKKTAKKAAKRSRR